MFIEYSEEQNMLRDSAERYLRDNYSFDSRQAAVKQARGYDADQWQTFAELGWLAMTFKEESDGFGGGALETMILCEQFGKFLVLEPYLESVVLVGGLIEAGAQPAIKEQYLSGLIAGELQGAFAYLEEGSVADPTHVQTTAESSADGFVLNGKKTVVLNGPEADCFVISARTGAAADESGSSEGISLFFVSKDAPGLSLTNYKTYDGRSASELQLENVAVTTQRKQFGQSISGFQVLRHRMVDMFMEIELTRSLLMATAWKLDNNAADAEQCVAALKAKVGKAGRYVSHNAVQLHGGIGTTDEFSVGHYFKRLAVIGVMFGSRDSHLSRYSQLSTQSSAQSSTKSSAQLS